MQPPSGKAATATEDTFSWHLHAELVGLKTSAAHILQPAFNLFRHVLDFDAAAVWSLRTGGEFLPILYGEKSLPEPFYSHPPRAELARAILETDKSVCWRTEELAQYGVRSHCCVGKRLEVLDGGHGVLELHRIEGEPFQDDDLNIVDQLAELASHALATAQQARQLARQRDLSLQERQELESQLEQQVSKLSRLQEISSALTLVNAHLNRTMTASQGQLSAVLNSISEGLMVYDLEERVILANPQMYRTYGVDPNSRSLLGQKVGKVLSLIEERLAIPGRARRLDRELEHNQQPFLEEDWELKNPARFVKRRVSPIRDPEGHLLGYVELHHDLTESKRSERLRDELIALVSHELRTPLMSILGYAQLLQQHPQVNEAKRFRWLDMIVAKSRALNRLIDQILDLSRLRANRFILHRTPTNLAELVGRVVMDMAAGSPDYHFDMKLSDVGVLNVDPERLAIALSQVLENAMRYSPKGSNIRVRLERRPNQEAIIAVSDEGMGIEPEYIEKIYDPFFRVPKSSIQEIEGSGLGLSISRGLVRAHHGRIWCESTPGQGSTFYIALPARELESRTEN